MAPPLVREATSGDRDLADDIFRREFGPRQLVADGRPVSTDAANLLVAETPGGIVGALAWRQQDEALHIMALATDPMWQRGSVGGSLLAEAELVARRLSLRQVLATLTNDNIPAQYFYQRRGYRLSAVLPGVIAGQPQNRDLTGFAGIPILDEVQLVKALS